MRVFIERVLAEKRSWLMPLAAVFVLNVAVYGLAVYPLTVKARNTEARARGVATELTAAERDNGDAQAARAARDRANSALNTFYTDVLPHDLAGANRITYLRLAQLAAKLGLRAQRRSYEPEQPERNSTLGRLKISMTLAGDYEDIRQFIYQLETGPQFVVIEEIALTEEGEAGSSQVLTLGLSTYYQARTNGTTEGQTAKGKGQT